MSRVGIKPVPIASGVEVSVAGGTVRVKGPKATLQHPVAPHTSVEVRDGTVVVKRLSEEKPAKAAHGLMRSLLSNMIAGVTQGFERKLDIVGVGYKAEMKGKELILVVGYSHPVSLRVPEGLDVRLDSATRITVAGPDRRLVGQFAAVVRKIRPPEPYKGKGIRYADERIRRKVGKSATGT
jgi:large subunit ribosomal protein L6